MAAAEARAAWQRTANRCFVQEDAKRAPKLACCPSSKLQYESSYGDAANVPNHPAATFMPLNWNPTNSNLPPDTKWWLQLQPNFAYQKNFTHEQLNSLAELDGKRNGNVIPTSNHRERALSSEDNFIDLDKSSGSLLSSEDNFIDQNKSSGTLLEPHRSAMVTCMKHDSEARVQELKAANNSTKPFLQHKADMSEYRCRDEELMDWEPVDLLITNQPKKSCLGMEETWMWGDNDPWWRIADKDELASLVAQKSLESIENCDLPQPQTIHIQRGPFGCLASFNHEIILSSSLDQKICSSLCNPIEHAQCCPASGSMAGKHWPSTEVRYSYFDSEKPCSGTQSSNTSSLDPKESSHISENDRSKAQLLEALCHSQTRAREAEKAAQQAYTEKEHIIKLIFKQASHLFAYKQWLQVLQLESLLLQLKAKDNQLSVLFPVLPWMPLTARRMRKGVHKMMRRKTRKKKYDICEYAIAVAVGLSLVSAGLLLGWTLGWLLPSL